MNIWKMQINYVELEKSFCFTIELGYTKDVIYDIIEDVEGKNVNSKHLSHKKIEAPLKEV